MKKYLKEEKYLFLIGIILIIPSIFCLEYGAPLFEVFHQRLLNTSVMLLALFFLSRNCPKWLSLILFLQVILLFVSNILELVSFYLQSKSFNEAFWGHFSMRSLLVGAKAYPVLVFVPAMVLSFFIWVMLKYIRSKRHSEGKKYLTYLLLSNLFIFFLLPSSFKDLALSYLAIKPKEITSLEVELLKKQYNLKGLDITKSKISATAGKNIIIIYLESLESIYLENNIFPGLTPNLQELRKEGLSFTNVVQFPGTAWTIAGIVASQAGIPLIEQFTTGNTIFSTKYGYMKHVIALGDVLKKAGYMQVYMGGADSRFAGKVNFLKDHGYDEVLGFESLKDNLSDPLYSHSWGLYDDTLFELSLKKFHELAHLNRPFNLTMLTLDTHNPSGFLSRSCPDYIYKGEHNSILEAVHCTDYLVGNFLKELKKSPVYSETVVAIMTDHLALRNIAEEYYPPSYKRQLLIILLNSGKTGEINTLASHFDFSPTLFDLMRVKTNANFIIGQNILAEPDGSRFNILNNKEGRDFLLTLINEKSDINHGKICSNKEGLLGMLDEQDGKLKILFSTTEKTFTLPREFFRSTKRKPFLSFWVQSDKQRNITDLGISESYAIQKRIMADNNHNYFILSKGHELFISENGLIKKSSGYNFQFTNSNKSIPPVKGWVESLDKFHISTEECQKIAEK